MERNNSQRGRFSRRKGANFERLIANMLKPYFPTAKRGIGQTRNAAEVSDVEVPGFWIECKRGKKVNIRKAFEQAHSVAKPEVQDSILVIAQEDHKPITVSMEFGLFTKLIAKLNEGNQQ